MTLAYRRVGAGEPLLLLHGLGSQWQVWEPVLALLSRERDVAAVDLPGFGESPPFEPDVAPTPDRIARSVAALLDELGWKDPHVAGNSLGGWVALELARMGRARSVVAISPAGLWSSGELRFARSSLRASRWVARAASRLTRRDGNGGRPHPAVVADVWPTVAHTSRRRGHPSLAKISVATLDVGRQSSEPV